MFHVTTWVDMLDLRQHSHNPEKQTRRLLTGALLF
jgi:hypothetical protein